MGESCKQNLKLHVFWGGGARRFNSVVRDPNLLLIATAMVYLAQIFEIQETSSFNHLVLYAIKQNRNENSASRRHI